MRIALVVLLFSCGPVIASDPTWTLMQYSFLSDRGNALPASILVFGFYDSQDECEADLMHLALKTKEYSFPVLRDQVTGGIRAYSKKHSSSIASESGLTCERILIPSLNPLTR